MLPTALHAQIKEVYNQEYLEKFKERINKILGYEGVTDAQIEILDRDEVDWSEELQPAYLSITPAGVSKIKTRYIVDGYDFECEPQVITNMSTWCPENSTLAEWKGGKFYKKITGVSGFKRNDAQDELKKEGEFFVDNNYMVYISVKFKDPRAYIYGKDGFNVTYSKDEKTPNTPENTVSTLRTSIELGINSKNLYKLDAKNSSLLMKEIKKLTPDKRNTFRKEVQTKFYVMTNTQFTILYKGNLEKKLTEFKLPKSGEEWKERGSYFYVGSNGEMKTTWYNADKKISLKEKPIDFAIYIGIPSDNIYFQRLQEVRKFISSLRMRQAANDFTNGKKFSTDNYGNLNSSISKQSKFYRLSGFISQILKPGLPDFNGANEKEVYGHLIRHPYNWFGVFSKEEMIEFLKEHTTTIGKSFGEKDKIELQERVESEYKDIMTIYENSKVALETDDKLLILKSEGSSENAA
tara:strand:+ start:142 stop:1536 length:1395 start_codon:yes stop_codon:yes gene_type:complete